MRYTRRSEVLSQYTNKMMLWTKYLFVYLIILLTPIFYLPFTYEYFETSKLVLLISLEIIVILIELINAFITKKLKVFVLLGLFPMLMLCLYVFITSFYSTFPEVSFDGYYARGYDTPLFFFSGFLFLLIIINTIKTRFDFNFVKNILFFDAFLLSVFEILNYFNILHFPKTFSPALDISILPFILFWSVIFILYDITILIENKLQKIIYSFILMVILYGIALSSNFYNLLLFLSIGLIILFYGFRNGKKLLIYYSLLLEIILIVFMFLNGQSNYLYFYILPWKFEFSILRSVTFSNIKTFFFGTGGDTYYFDFLRYAPKDFFYSNLYLGRFTKSNNEILQILQTFGITGLAIWSCVFYYYIYLYRKLNRIIQEHDDNVYLFFILLSIILLGSSFIFVPLTISLFLFILVSFFFLLFLEIKYTKISSIKLNIKNINFDLEKSKINFNILIVSILIIGSVVLLINTDFNYFIETKYYTSINGSGNILTDYNNAKYVYETDPGVYYYFDNFAYNSIALAELIQQQNTNKLSTTEKKTDINQLVIDSQGRFGVSPVVYGYNPDLLLNMAELDVIIYMNLDNNTSFLNNASNISDYLLSTNGYNLNYLDLATKIDVLLQDKVNSLKYSTIMYNLNNANANFNLDYVHALELNGRYRDVLPILGSIIQNTNKNSSEYNTLLNELKNDSNKS